MGGFRVPTETDVTNLPNGLWCRGGFSDVRVCVDGIAYCIAEKTLWDLFAEEYKRRHISQLEQMDADDVRAKLGIGEKR